MIFLYEWREIIHNHNILILFSLFEFHEYIDDKRFKFFDKKNFICVCIVTIMMIY